jgi:hypothetical protein
MSPALIGPRRALLGKSFSPRDLPGLGLWLRADSGLSQDSAGTTPATADADPVGRWADTLSGGGLVATQATGSKRFTLKTGANGVNGRAVLRADGVDDGLQVASLALGSFTALFVFKASGTAGLVYEHSATASSNDGGFLYTSTNATIKARRAATNDERDLAVNWGVDGVWRVVTQDYDGTNTGHTLRLNGTSQTLSDRVNGNPGTSTATAALNLACRNQASLFTAGDYAEVLFFTPRLTTAQTQQVERYLGPRYALTVA